MGETLPIEEWLEQTDAKLKKWKAEIAKEKGEVKISPDKIVELIKACREGDSIVWDEPNGEVYKIKVEKKYPIGWTPTVQNTSGVDNG